ncbi:hypothetical protein G7077_09220 [Sphingomonas piscis]|uniref:Uncharacterized protein n=1 Tax=Sphingomonas piscis TaxID=2714943 RepID=A0A6G7YQN4_9SPHN|nr:hypothetical protein [Sphingomonas piscis]QIK79046.1 hypothetical protein G7077_09220 [Sphingomonas piscis]
MTARRMTSIILLFLGGWLLSGEAMIAWIDAGAGLGIALGVMLFMSLFALAFLLLGAWASPGARWADLGLTLMIVAAFTLFAGVTTAIVFLDPTAKPFLPPEMPDLSFNPVLGTLNLLLIGGIGHMLRRWDLTRRQG